MFYRCVHMSVHMQMCAYGGQRSINVSDFLSFPLPYVFETGSLANPTQLGWPANELQRFSCPCPPYLCSAYYIELGNLVFVFLE